MVVMTATRAAALPFLVVALLVGRISAQSPNSTTTTGSEMATTVAPTTTTTVAPTTTTVAPTTTTATSQSSGTLFTTLRFFVAYEWTQ